MQLEILYYSRSLLCTKFGEKSSLLKRLLKIGIVFRFCVFCKTDHVSAALLQLIYDVDTFDIPMEENPGLSTCSASTGSRS
jgi:hypothetical protein